MAREAETTHKPVEEYLVATYNDVQKLMRDAQAAGLSGVNPRFLANILGITPEQMQATLRRGPGAEDEGMTAPAAVQATAAKPTAGAAPTTSRRTMDRAMALAQEIYNREQGAGAHDTAGRGVRGAASSEFGTLSPAERSQLSQISMGLSLAGALGAPISGMPIGAVSAIDAAIRSVFGAQPRGFVSTVSAADLEGLQGIDPNTYGQIAESFGLPGTINPATLAAELEATAAATPTNTGFAGDPEAQAATLGSISDPSAFGGGSLGGYGPGPDPSGTMGASAPGTETDPTGQAESEAGMGGESSGEGTSAGEAGQAGGDPGSSGGPGGATYARGGVAKAKRGKPKKATFGEGKSDETAIFIPESMKKPGRQQNERDVMSELQQQMKELGGGSELESLIQRALDHLNEGRRPKRRP